MIILSLCNSCFQPFQINMQAEDMHLVRSIADEDMELCPCPRLCGGKINLKPVQMIKDSKLASRAPMTITSLELYKAVNGLGLPDEIPNDPIVLEALLKSSKITGLVAEAVGNRVFLHELHLSSGTVIHLSSGTRGAQILKITKEHQDATS